LADAQLAAALAADLDGTFEQLVLAYQDRLYAFALRLTGSPQDAEEVVQDAFVRAYRAAARYPAERVGVLALRPWLYQITLNVARNRARSRRLRLVSLEQPGDGGATEPEDDEASRPEPMLDRAECQENLAALVAALPVRYRAAVVLRHVHDLPYVEVAAILGQPIGTIKGNVHRGIRMLREAMDKEAAGHGDRGHEDSQERKGGGASRSPDAMSGEGLKEEELR
jgi:RNA polymerase sigma-70 factor (ECF subfamily)